MNRNIQVLVCAACVAASAELRAASIQQVQTGSATSIGTGVIVVSMAAIDPARSFLVFQSAGGGNRPGGSFLRGRITAANQITFTRVTSEAVPVPIDIRWFVASFLAGVRVQRGEVVAAGTTVNVPISAVASMAQSFVTWSKTANAGDADYAENDPVAGDLTTVSNLQFRSSIDMTGHAIAWEVVEFTDPADIAVRRGSVSMLGSTSIVNVPVSPPVDLTRSFVLVGFRTGGRGNDVGARMLRARLTAPGNIAIDRSITGSPDDIGEIGWQLVELRDGSHVQGGSAAFAAGAATVTAALAPTVDVARSIALASVQPVGGQAMGRTPYAGDDVIGVGSATLALAWDQLSLVRPSSAAAADLGWFVIQFHRPRRLWVTE